MKKNGFTLIELLAVVVILTILAAIVIPSVFSMIRKAKDNSFNILVDSFEENTRLYATRHRDEVENNLDAYNYFVVTLNDLKANNLLKTPLLDPRTEEEIPLSKKIIVTRKADMSLEICYEDRGCYVPTILGSLITDDDNLVTGSNEGLQYDLTNDIYYYRGSDPDNWIEFNGYLWRIVRVNIDGSIKLVFEGTKSGSSTIQNGTIANSALDSGNSNNYNNALTVKTVLQDWYNNNLTAVNKLKIQPKQLSKTQIAYDPAGTLKGNFISNEGGQLTTDSLSIGLLMGSEYLYASLDADCSRAYKTTGDFGNTCKNSNYLYKSNYNYWTMTPTTNTTDLWEVKSSGSLGIPVAANNTSEVRPVINLIASVIVDRGNGTFENPYILKDEVNLDKTKPTITMNGVSPVDMELGTLYTDAGATATDATDGDLTSEIVTVSNLNINVIGNYTIRYVVSDKSGNKATATRMINVVDTLSAYVPSKGVNKPKLAAGMTPIKWNGSAWINTTEEDPDWYSYLPAENKWANAKTADGSFWVWIPRYVYRITYLWNGSNIFSNEPTGNVDIQFSMNTDDTRGGTVTLDTGSTANASNNKWTNHPAFTFGSDQLTGIWVAKFEATAAEGVSNNFDQYGTCQSSSDNMTSKTVKIVPSAKSWRCIQIGNAYTVTRSMETNSVYGWGTSGTGIDTHMMKNVEWGAVAYLTRVTRNDQVWKNPADDYSTGCVGDSFYNGGDTTTGCKYSYETANGVLGSSTGTIYGVYDMSGGAREMVAAYVDSGVAALTDNGSEIINDDAKYRDVYPVGATNNYWDNADESINLKGDAVYETSCGGCQHAWFADFAYMPSQGGPWFLRGGDFYGDAGTFQYELSGGNYNTYYGFRPVIAVKAGL